MAKDDTIAGLGKVSQSTNLPTRVINYESGTNNDITAP